MPNSDLRPYAPACAPAALTFAIALALGLPAPAEAAATEPRSPANTIVVTNCNDGGAGSLRAAAANAIDGSVIDMTQLACSAITLSSGEITAAATRLTIKGPGADRLSVRVPEGSHWRNFTFANTSQLASDVNRLYDLTIEGGHVENASGGCLWSVNYLEVNSSNVRNCRVVATNEADTDPRLKGGAIYGFGHVTLVLSTVTGSSVSTGFDDLRGSLAGGGIFARTGLSANQSTISDNAVFNSLYASGGGVYTLGGTNVIVRSTISGNSTNYRYDGHGRNGGIYVGARAGGPGSHSLLISESTIAGNYAGDGAIALGSGAGTRIDNSTIAGNFTALARLSPVVSIFANSLVLSSTIIAQNYELQTEYALTDLAVSAGVTVSGNSNLIMNSPASPPGTLTANPRLGALGDNGGPTATMALPADSPAVDRGGNDSNDNWDQRGYPFARVAGTGADIGAFESNDVIFSNGFDPPGTLAPATPSEQHASARDARRSARTHPTQALGGVLPDPTARSGPR